MMIFTWLILPIIVAILVAIYVGYSIFRGVQFFGKNLSRKKQIWISIVIGVFLIAPAVNILGVWFIALIHVAAFTLICDLAFWIIRKLLKKPLPAIIEGIYRSGCIAFTVTAVFFSYGYYNMSHITRTEYQITTEKEIRSEGYKIAVLSDLHYGISLNNEELMDIAKTISSENPDVVILDGDIVDESTTKQQMKDAFAILGTITSKYGNYFVYGNHDFSNYSDNPHYSGKELTSSIENAGIHILCDSTIEINNDLILIGRADKSYGDSNRKEISQLVSSLDKRKEWVILDHQPTEYNAVRKAGGDLIVSGHTHAGQIWPAGIISSLINIDDLNYGYKKEGNLNAVVTSGIAGWGYPIRTEKHSEYVIININWKGQSDE